MDDRELLELAAKAAGYQVEWVKNSGCYYRCEEEVGREQWDPLEDDGDALRLAVKLGLVVDFGNSMVLEPIVVIGAGTDPITATCRAIVIAAADSLRSMQ